MAPVTRVASAALCALAGLSLSSCGGNTRSSSREAAHVQTRSTATVPRVAAVRVVRRRPSPPSYPRLEPGATSTSPTGLVPAASWRGHPAAWVARVGGVALLEFNQRLVELRLHSGTIDAGAAGWRYGPSIAGRERQLVVAAFNGGFKFDTGAGGFESYGRVGFPLRAGLGSIVTYSDGLADIGTWRAAVPAPGQRVVSVRQNLQLLIDAGRSAGNLGCQLCWGATLGGVPDPARSALGITSEGNLVWAGGEHLTVSALADALLAAHVTRAVELDINPEWVAAYLYGHRGGRGALAAVPIVPGQPGVPGQFLAPYSRDFFTVVASASTAAG
jgi:hypothetical protein